MENNSEKLRNRDLLTEFLNACQFLANPYTFGEGSMKRRQAEVRRLFAAVLERMKNGHEDTWLRKLKVKHE